MIVTSYNFYRKLFFLDAVNRIPQPVSHKTD